MIAIRALTRTLPRAAARSNITRAIPAAPLRRIPVPQRSLLSAFSTSTIRNEPAGDSDQALSAKLETERSLEVEESDPKVVPDRIKDFFDNSPWQVEDTPGTQLVTVSRSFGNETIKIEFNISDMNQQNEEFDELDEDGALEDEDYTSQGRRTINQSGTKGGKFDVEPEDRVSPADKGDFDEEPLGEAAYPLQLNITISKPGKGAAYIVAQAEDGTIDIEGLNYFSDADIIDPSTPEQVRTANAVYQGPPFTNLDPELQSMLQLYLEERSINTELANVLFDYVDFKEQREYVQWLDNMKKFIDA